jgi:uncharacterized protein (DUF2164 family)
VCTIILEQTNATISSCVAEILVEFIEKKAGEQLMAAGWRAMRKLEEKEAADAGYPA